MVIPVRYQGLLASGVQWLRAVAKTIEFRQLQYFVAVAEELHFGRAAHRLGMSQPPLSRQIKALERGLDIPLFERSKHGVRLTDAGEVFLEETRMTLEQVSRAAEMAQRAYRGELGQLTLGVAPLLEGGAYPALEARMGKLFPRIQISRHVLASDEQIPLVRKGTLDAGLVRLPLEEHDFLTVEFLFREALLVMMRDDNPLAKRRTVRIRELTGQKRIAIRKKFNSAFYQYISRLCDRSGYRAARVVPVNSVHELIDSVLAGRGVALVPASVKREVRIGLHYARVADQNAETQIGLVYLRNHQSQVVDLLQRAVNEIEWRNVV